MKIEHSKTKPQTTVLNRRYQTSNLNLLTSIIYHDIFGYPLTKSDLSKWKVAEGLGFKVRDLRIDKSRGYYFLEGRQGIILKRVVNEKASRRKLKIAKLAGTVLAKVPTVRMIGITGALAMKNADEESDIDLAIVASGGTLWTTRLIVYCLLFIAGLSVRKPNRQDQEDKLCLNMWFDEGNLIWRKRNIFTAHEIAQIIPIVNKDRTYEKFLQKNKWILDYWPKSVKIRNPKFESRNNLEFSKLKHINIVSNFVLRASNFIAFKMQYLHMRSKITREVVTPSRAIFHPFDWSKYIQKNFLLDKSSF